MSQNRTSKNLIVLLVVAIVLIFLLAPINFNSFGLNVFGNDNTPKESLENMQKIKVTGIAGTGNLYLKNIEFDKDGILRKGEVYNHGSSDLVVYSIRARGLNSGGDMIYNGRLNPGDGIDFPITLRPGEKLKVVMIIEEGGIGVVDKIILTSNGEESPITSVKTTVKNVIQEWIKKNI